MCCPEKKVVAQFSDKQSESEIVALLTFHANQNSDKLSRPLFLIEKTVSVTHMQTHTSCQDLQPFVIILLKTSMEF